MILTIITCLIIVEDTYAQCDQNQVETTITLNLDDFAQETTWQLLRATDGIFIASGGPYTNNNGQTVSENICVEQGCYDLYLLDSGLDGFCCEDGNGSFSVSVPGQNLISGNADFLDFMVETFCIGLNLTGPACNIGFNVNNTPAACGFSSGGIQINAFNGLGDYQYRLGSGGWTSSNVFSNLAPGDYQAYVRNSNGTCLTGPELVTIAEDCTGQPCSVNLVELNINFDSNPDEVVWQLFANDTLVPFAGGLYPQGTTNFTQNFCLPDGCYSFVIFDQKQNGICCESGQGSYSLSQDGVLLGGGNGQYTSGEVTAFCVGENNQGFVPAIVFTATAFLQGALLNTSEPGLMRDDLREQGLIPLTEPYTNLPNFNHVGAGGGEIIPQATIDFDDPLLGLVDWCFLEIRSPNNPQEVLASQSVLILKNGTVARTSETNTNLIAFPDLPSGYYYVSLRHRNHIGVMTGQPVGLGRIPINIDFSSNQTPFWGNNALADTGNGLLALWAGNCNASKETIFQGNNNDVDNVFFEVLSVPANTSFQSNYIHLDYSNSDVNMDGQVIFQGNNNDPNFIFFNVLGHPDNTNFSSNYIIQEQTP